MKRVRSTIASLLVSLALPSCSDFHSGIVYEVPPRAGQTLLAPSEEGDKFDFNDRYITGKSIEEILSSTVQVTNMFGFGTGTILRDQQTREDYVLTCFHVISDFPELITVKIDAQTFDVPEIYKVDENNDLALLKLSGSHDRFFAGKIATSLEPGYQVVGVGFPFFKKKTLLYGHVSTDMEGDDVYYQIVEGNINMGDSGGGFFVFKRGLPFYGGTINFRYRGENGVDETRGVGGVVDIRKVRDFIKSTPLADDYL
ncbi:trypsin-like peptidase domain-containing protein [Candidatus Woesearchaeota archaeon]|nr:trypsin-like peptidase domain-containing protein [Candidatus Woesearchaeota archaeon]